MSPLSALLAVACLLLPERLEPVSAPGAAPVSFRVLWPGEAPRLTVVYVHGYWDDLDSAWRDHALPAQFEQSGVPAVFVAAQAPSGPAAPVRWPDLESLLGGVERSLQRPLPREQIVLVGHSGAYRTLRLWLGHPGVRKVVLLDGFYGDARPFEAFLRRPDARLVLVGSATAPRTEAWLARLPDSSRERVEYHRAREGHRAIVTSGRWIPRLLAAHLAELPIAFASSPIGRPLHPVHERSAQP